MGTMTWSLGPQCVLAVQKNNKGRDLPFAR
jgi:hypothetical protein